MEIREVNGVRQCILTAKDIWHDLQKAKKPDDKGTAVCYRIAGTITKKYAENIIVDADEIILSSEIPHELCSEPCRGEACHQLELVTAYCHPAALAYDYDENKKITSGGDLYSAYGRYWVDENGNRWRQDKYSKAEAYAWSYTLRNCTNCTNGKNCTNCIDCVDCSDCEDCVKCDSAEKCKRCDNCKGIWNCDNCKHCDCSGDCVKCEYCHECGHCRNCKDCNGCDKCRDCERCDGCDKLDSCKDCKWCINCKDCTDCIRCRDCEHCRNCNRCAYCTFCEKGSHLNAQDGDKYEYERQYTNQQEI